MDTKEGKIESIAMETKAGMDNRAYVNAKEPEDYRYLSPFYTRGRNLPDKNMNGKMEPLTVDLGKKGVGDLEHVHIDGMHSQPGSPKMYDYADYGHQYEELPGGRKSIAKCNMESGDSRSEYQSSGGATDIVSVTGDTANIISEKRKRVNPLYDQMNQSMPSIYNKTRSGRDDGLVKQVRCLKCALVVLVVISVAALAVSLFAVISRHTEDKDSDLETVIERLKSDYEKLEDLMSSFKSNDTLQILSNLLKKVDTLENNVSSELSVLRGQAYRADGDIQMIAQEIAQTHSNLSDVISLLNMTLQLQLHNVSKQPGPRGPQGVANFSLCTYYNVSNNAATSDNFPSFSPWAPTETDLETNVALFGGCTVDGGLESVFETHAITNQRVQYRCKCSGTVANKNRRICYVHIFSCPRES